MKARHKTDGDTTTRGSQRKIWCGMSKKGKDFDFSKRAASYDEGYAGKLSQRFYSLLQNEVKLDEGMRILDVGCGTGALLKRLCGKRNIDACGIDAEESMIAVAARQCPDYSFRRRKANKSLLTMGLSTF